MCPKVKWGSWGASTSTPEGLVWGNAILQRPWICEGRSDLDLHALIQINLHIVLGGHTQYDAICIKI